MDEKMTDIHADDYALSIRTSEEILELMKEGVLDSISIVPNNSCFDSCMQLLKDHIADLPYLPKMSVHINLVEGLCLSKNDGSLIKDTWKSLFFAWLSPLLRNDTKERIKKEISCQISVAWAAIEECIKNAKENGISVCQEKLRIDSHQHTHMIPVVWSAISECISENGYECEYIRNSKEPVIPFIRHTGLWSSYRIVNFIKNRILCLFSATPDRYAKKQGQDMMYLWGLVMSGRMDPERIEELYGDMKKLAKSKGRKLEILFHPGRMSEDELCEEIPKSSADEFYLSPNRDTEKEGARRCRLL